MHSLTDTVTSVADEAYVSKMLHDGKPAIKRDSKEDEEANMSVVKPDDWLSESDMRRLWPGLIPDQNE